MQNKKYKINYNNHHVNSTNLFTLDENILVDLFSIVSESYLETEMREYILKFIKDNVPTAIIEYDVYGNVYVTKTNSKETFYPTIVSHMDEVVTYSSSRTVVKIKNIMMGINSETGEFAGIGGDDKCGIYICLELLRLMDHIKVAFFVAEETGGEGSDLCDISFFDDSRFILQPDRYSNSSVVTDTNGLYVTGEEFEFDLESLMYDYGYYADSGGTFTDVGVLAKRGVNIAVSNISCGYYEQHSEEEVVCLPDLENSLNFIYKIMTTLEDKRYMHRRTGTYYDFSNAVIPENNTKRSLKKPKKFVYLGYGGRDYDMDYNAYNYTPSASSQHSYPKKDYYFDQYDHDYAISKVKEEEDYDKAIDIAFINKSKLKTINDLTLPTLESYIIKYKSELVKKFGYSGYTKLCKTLEDGKKIKKQLST